MTFAQFLFLAIDKLFDGAQNNKKMLRFKDVKFEVETDIAYGKDDAEKLDTYFVKKTETKNIPCSSTSTAAVLWQATSTTAEALQNGRQTKVSLLSTSTTVWGRNISSRRDCNIS